MLVHEVLKYLFYNLDFIRYSISNGGMSPLNQIASHETGAFKVDTTHEARTGLRNEAAHLVTPVPVKPLWKDLVHRSLDA